VVVRAPGLAAPEEAAMAMTELRSVSDMVRATAERRGDHAAFRWIDDNLELQSVSWTEFLEDQRTLSKALIAFGFERGTAASILSYSRYRWVLADLALEAIGCVTVGIYHTLPAKDCAHIVDHSDSILVFAEDTEQVAKLREVRERIPKVRAVVLLTGSASADDEWVMDFETFCQRGAAVSDAAVDERIAAVGPDDPAAIVYTSGTTGVPKGAVLTHENLTFTPQSVDGSADIHDGDETLLFLPLAHVFARTCVFTALFRGTTTTFSRGIDTIAEDLRVARPQWFASVPRVYEKVYSRIIAGAEAKGGLALKIFRWACSVGERVSDRRLQHRPVPALLRLQYRLATRLVFAKVHEAMGGRVRWCISGAAPLNPRIGKLFHAAGVVIVEGLGMTEDTSFSHLNRLESVRFGWVGLPGPGIEQRIADDGEVLIRGRNVMKGYYKMPEETAATLTEDGWLHTGDLGMIDEAGFLKITGRKKELIVTAGGKNCAPAAIEGQLCLSKYIEQACVVGDGRPYLTALLALDLDAVRELADQSQIDYTTVADLQESEAVLTLIEEHVRATNAELPSFETVKAFRIVDELTIDDGTLTPTMKIKRNVIVERHADLIASMYEG
jgi:long-chain acyl-CoA synthetase